MDFGEFETKLREFREERSGRSYPVGFQLFDAWTASPADLEDAEIELGTRLPLQYKTFMQRVGGGVFAFVEILPVRSVDGRSEDLLSVNQGDFSMPGFIAVAPVGTGDWWGFVTENHVCRDEVSFLDHEDGSIQFDSTDFFEFALTKGLREER